MKPSLLFFALFYVNSLFGQPTVELENKYSKHLEGQFKSYEILKFSKNELEQLYNNNSAQLNLNLDLGGSRLSVELFGFKMFSSDYQAIKFKDGKQQISKQRPNISFYKNYPQNSNGSGGFVCISKQHLFAHFLRDNKSYFIEPLVWYLPKADPYQFICYEANDVIQSNAVSCLAVQSKQWANKSEQHLQAKNRFNHCLLVEVALAFDKTIFDWLGSESAVEAWGASILGLVNMNYDNEFDHGLELVVSASYVATSPSSDPWWNINDISAHLDAHYNWGNGGGYGGASYDVATAWTRKYTSGPVGVSILESVCTSDRYNVCSAFSNSSNISRQLQAHEMGHNFSAIHDGPGSPHIMAAGVNGSSSWSAQSISLINNHINSRWCLDPCINGAPPSAKFIASTQLGCAPFQVQFSDLSTQQPTTWLWTFPGGTPSSSTSQNPIVSYTTHGVYDVSLEATNAFGVGEKTEYNYINVIEPAVPEFDHLIQERHVFFTNQSKFASSFEWDFGDGTKSMQENPEHDYKKDGDYTVVFKATNYCGSKTISKRIQIKTRPLANFAIDSMQRFCAPTIVEITDQSTNNVLEYFWSFPNGEPSFSTDKNPKVKYERRGEYDVSLVVKSKFYSDSIKKKGFIKIDSLPENEFSYRIQGLTLQMDNKSKNVQKSFWTFGRVGSSTEYSPSFTFSAEGEYMISLQTSNNCGISFDSQWVDMYLIPKVDFKVETQEICVGKELKLISQCSRDVSDWQWNIQGGIPSFSKEKNPVVTFGKPGLYNVKLEVKNSNGSNSITKTNFIKVLSSLRCPVLSKHYEEGDNEESFFDSSNKISLVEDQCFAVKQLNNFIFITHCEKIENFDLKMINLLNQSFINKGWVCDQLSENELVVKMDNQLHGLFFFVVMINQKTFITRYLGL